MNRPLAAVIPNRDGADLLARTLPPLVAELRDDKHDILVVDDASIDDSVTWLRRTFPQIRVLALPHVVGFGAACNLGFREARHSLVLLLNSDMYVTPGSLTTLAEHFADPLVFAAGPRFCPVESSPPPSPARSAGAGYHYQLGAPAGGGLFRREAFLSLGGFDPLYAPFYWEDLDLGFAAWKQGWRIVFDARCRFLHLENKTIRRLYPASFVRRIRTRNRFLFGLKNLRTPRLRVQFLSQALVRSVGDLVNRGDPNGLTGAVLALARAPQAYRRRCVGPLSDAAVLQHSGTSIRELSRV